MTLKFITEIGRYASFATFGISLFQGDYITAAAFLGLGMAV